MVDADVTVMAPDATKAEAKAKADGRIVEVVAAGTTPPFPEIKRTGPATVVLLSGVGDVELPTKDTAILDVFEMYQLDGVSTVLPAEGSTINGASSGMTVIPGRGVIFRKVSSTDWRTVGFS